MGITSGISPHGKTFAAGGLKVAGLYGCGAGVRYCEVGAGSVEAGAVVVVGVGSGSTSGARGGESMMVVGSITGGTDSMTAGELVAASLDTGASFGDRHGAVSAKFAENGQKSGAL